MMIKHGTLSNETYEYIKGEACALLVKLDVKCMPVNGYEIAAKMGITLIPYSSLSRKKLRWAKKVSRDGFYYENNDNNFGQEIIYYNDIGNTYERQNMTILHEIGHCVLDHNGEDPDAEEEEANFFAKYIIAPPVLIDKICPEGPDDIMFFFDISYEAACYALEYYQCWLRFHYAYGSFTSYERKLLTLYNTHFRSA